MSVILIILGLAICSYQTPVASFFGWALIIIGILRALFKKKPPREVYPENKKKKGDSDGYTGRVHGDTYYGVYDRDGNYIRQEDLRETVNGDYITPDGDIVEKDSDGEYRMY